VSMFGGLTEGGDAPYLKITTADATYTMPTYDLEGRPAVVAMQPQEPFDQVSIIGDTSKVSDRRVAQIIPSDQRGGAGRARYTETEGVTDYRQSDCDTRHLEAIVCRPKTTSLGSASGGEGIRLFYAGYAGAKIHSYARGIGVQYHPGTGTVWTSCTGMGGANPWGYVKAFGYTWICGDNRIYRSSDGIAFTAVAAAVFPFNSRGLAAHDGKLWTLVLDTTNNQATLYASTNPTAAAASVAFAAVASFPLLITSAATEAVYDMVPWKDASGSPALMILTTQRLLTYNAVGATIEEYDDFSDNNPDGGAPDLSVLGMCAIAFKTTGDLYIGQGRHNDYLMRYSPGAGFGKIGPNQNGGLEKRRQGAIRALAQNAYGLGVWTAATTVVGDTSLQGGAAWFMSSDGGWHCLNRDLGGAPRTVAGGGIGGRKFWTAFTTGGGTCPIEEQDLPNVGSLPQFAVGRKYDTYFDGQTHNYSSTDFGVELSRKTLLGFTVHCRKSDGTEVHGLDDNASIKVRYRTDGGTWTTVTQYIDDSAAPGVVRTNATGIFTSATTGVGWPLRLVVNDEFGVPFYDMEWSVTLYTTDEDETPVVVAVAPRATRTPPPHYTYEAVVDLASLEVNGGLATTVGGGPTAVDTLLNELDHIGTMVSLEFGGQGVRHSVRSCEFAMAPQLMAHLGTGRYRLIFKSVGADPSGLVLT
jgi:hypothetical protein